MSGNNGTFVEWVVVVFVLLWLIAIAVAKLS